MKFDLKTINGFVAIGTLLIGTTSVRAALPKDVTLVPFYDINDTALSFKKAEQSVVGMYEVPGMPEHFLVVGYFGYVWSLYPDMSKTYAPGAIKDYKKKQVANFNTMVCKGWEQGALGAAFDPNFASNHYFYIIYNKYAEAGKYHGGNQPNGNDGPGVSALVSVERWKLSNDLATLTRDTTIFLANHSTGYGSSNMTFGKDGLLYISTDAYSQNSWDSTIFMRKILRIDVSKQDAGKMYSIPTTNPFYNATNPLVKKEIFAFGFRNTYSIVNDMITGSILGAEVGEDTWEEVNVIQSGKNYGWANGGDGDPSGGQFGVGIEGPCSNNTITGAAYNNGNKAPYSFNGDVNQHRTFTCADFTNGTWNFSHSGQPVNGTPTSLPGTGINCIILSQAYRGDPSSDFYGYHFVTDVNRKYFLAIKEGVSEVVNVGGVPGSYQFAQNDVNHDGITSFSEDSYGNMYVTMLSSSSGGAFDWHDIYKLKSTGMTPLATARSSSISVVQKNAIDLHDNIRTMVMTSLGTSSFLKLPEGMKHAEIYSLEGKLIWSNRNQSETSNDSFVRVPALAQTGAVGVRYMP